MFNRLRPYKVEDVVESAFLQSDSKRNEEWCIEDLKKSGLEPDDILASAPGNLRLPSFALAGYHIPYYDLQGRVITQVGSNYNKMWRTRYKLPEFSKEPRYLQPSKEQLALVGLPGILPYLLPYPEEYDNDETIFCVEGEKKTAAVIKHFRVPAFGISGCQMWRNPSGDGGIHPWILEYIRQHGKSKVCIIPDADVLRYDICATYGTFAHALQAAGFEVSILHPPAKIDDLIVERLRAGDFEPSLLGSLERLAPAGLVQTPASLAHAYNLAFKSSDKGVVTVHQHTSNVMTLLEKHSAFPRIWRNNDTNRVMVGEDVATPDLTEMEIANHFQHHFGFDKVTHRIIYSCIQSLAKKNQRSPMLEKIMGTVWDRQPRLDDWLQRLWGVQDSAYIREVGSKWLISACARMDHPGAKVDWMMIVVGPQGTGKTSMPGIMFKGNALTMYGDQNDKDLHMLLHSSLCVGFDELDSFGKRESSNLKAMITRQEDAFRPPYGASIEVFQRRFTLYGCGNRYEFLQHDPSGYRRYAIVEVTRLLDFSALQNEVEQLWAEAWHRYRQGDVKWWEISNASEHAKNYVVPNVLEERIQNWIQAQCISKHGTMVKDGVLQFTMSQLIAGIDEDASGKNTNTAREIAAILKSMGCEQKVTKVRGVAARVYHYKIPE